MGAPSFFRKAALEKLSTPEKLDQLIKITSLKAWIVLCLIGLTIGSAVTWGWLGSVKTKLNATGVLLGGEVYDVVSISQGQLVELKVKMGDVVKEGDVIATIEQTSLLQQIESTKANIEASHFELHQMEVYGSQDKGIQGDLINKQKENTEQQIKSNQKNLEFQKQQLEIEKNLLSKGLITKPQVVNRELQVEEAQNQIENLRASLVQMGSNELNLDYSHQQKRTLQLQRIAQDERRLEQLQETYEENSSIRSPHSGEVLEVLAKTGTVVRPGTPLFKLKNSDISSNDDLKGVLYVSSQDGKKIKVGMEALVVPSTVKPQEYGYMKATVTHVSEFPVTQQGLMTSMQNDQLVNSLLRMGAPFEVYVDLEKNEDSFSGYEWTSANGPELAINTGTTCMGKVTVKQEAPIAMVVPAFKKFFDLY